MLPTHQQKTATAEQNESTQGCAGHQQAPVSCTGLPAGGRGEGGRTEEDPCWAPSLTGPASLGQTETFKVPTLVSQSQNQQLQRRCPEAGTTPLLPARGEQQGAAGTELPLGSPVPTLPRAADLRLLCPGSSVCSHRASPKVAAAATVYQRTDEQQQLAVSV